MTAVAALGQVLGLKGVMRPPPVPAAFGRLLLGEWCHVGLLVDFPIKTLPRAGTGIIQIEVADVNQSKEGFHSFGVEGFL
jgi:hypothetical protein